MKRFLVLIPVVIALVIIECSTTPLEEGTEQRLSFQPVNTAGLTVKDSFIVGEFTSDGAEFSKASRYYSTANFLADLDILDDVDFDAFDSLSTVLFADLPAEGQTKEVVIPNAAPEVKGNDSIRDAYLFITKTTGGDRCGCYLIETNIPVGAMRNKNDTIFFLNNKTGFFKGEIPGNYANGVLSLTCDGDLLVYQGLVYPNLTPPLGFSAKGLKPDSQLNCLLSGDMSLDQIKAKLGGQAKMLENHTAKPGGAFKFLEKFVNMSLCAYSFLESDFDAASRYYDKAACINCPAPEDSDYDLNYKGLEKVMKYVIRAEKSAA